MEVSDSKPVNKDSHGNFTVAKMILEQACEQQKDRKVQRH